MNDLYEKQAIEKQYYEKEYIETIHFKDFIGKSPAIMKVFSQRDQVAETDATVLILGETGVGKEMVARSIHRHSPRNGKPFIRVHCSALSESLISSELFGHENGAFTGATTRHMGRFELANGGTIFLDEIGDISMETQVRLLRVLQSGEFERVGGHETLRSDFRLLAATNRDLAKEVEIGRFRQDLYYQLNVFPINVPSLSERKEDIPFLVHYFLTLYAQKFNKPLENINHQETEKLLFFEWPGNVRELEEEAHMDKIWMKSWPDFLPKETLYTKDKKPIFEYLRDNAKEYPDRTALIFYGRKVTYGELNDMSERFARFLVDSGLKKVDRIALFLPSCPSIILPTTASTRWAE